MADGIGAKLIENIAKVYVGKEKAVRKLLTGLFAGLHVLVEDIPGLGKTTLALTLARSCGFDFGRIQFTPDLLPGDILGMNVWDAAKREFVFKQGPLLHQFILADEINRASARTQSSLLEAMQENAITVDGRTMALPSPFFVLATQNPSSFAGTFPLPESQIDRFGISFTIGYPAPAEENLILDRFQTTNPLDTLEAVVSPEEIVMVQNQVTQMHVDPKIRDFIIGIAGATRKSDLVRLGCSPRASQHLLKAAQAEAFLCDRDFVIPEDVINTADVVIRHRIILSSQARMDNLSTVQVIERVIDSVPVPAGLR